MLTCPKCINWLPWLQLLLQEQARPLEGAGGGAGAAPALLRSGLIHRLGSNSRCSGTCCGPGIPPHTGLCGWHGAENQTPLHCPECIHSRKILTSNPSTRLLRWPSGGWGLSPKPSTCLGLLAWPPTQTFILASPSGQSAPEGLLSSGSPQPAAAPLFLLALEPQAPWPWCSPRKQSSDFCKSRQRGLCPHPHPHPPLRQRFHGVSVACCI